MSCGSTDVPRRDGLPGARHPAQWQHVVGGIAAGIAGNRGVRRAGIQRAWRGRADPERDSRAVYHAGAIAHIVKILRCQDNSWRAWFAEENITPIDIAYPVLWRNPTALVGTILEALGLDPGVARPPMLQRQADHRSDEWVDRYRQEAPLLGLPT